MSSQSVTLWIDQLKAGERHAAERLWQRYFHRLIGLAHKRLAGRPRLGADAEDVALSAFDSFFRAAEAGRFPKLRDRDDLWHILVTITVRKALHLLRDESRQKRGGGRVVGESSPELTAGHDVSGGMDLLMADEPDPIMAAQLTDICERLFERLPDDEVRQVARMRLEGFSVVEIADAIGRAVTSVERKLRLIRDVWNQELVSAA